MRNFIAGIFVGFMILAMFFFLFEGMATVQEQREHAALSYKIDNTKVGKTIQARGTGLFVTSKKGLVTDEMFKGAE
jgi:hypothetical protein